MSVSIKCLIIFIPRYLDTFCKKLSVSFWKLLILNLFFLVVFHFFFPFLATIAKMEGKLTLCQESLEGQRCAIRDFARDKGQTYLIADRDQLSIAP